MTLPPKWSAPRSCGYQEEGAHEAKPEGGEGTAQAGERSPRAGAMVEGSGCSRSGREDRGAAGKRADYIESEAESRVEALI
jgi:hypothetical protein